MPRASRARARSRGSPSPDMPADEQALPPRPAKPRSTPAQAAALAAIARQTRLTGRAAVLAVVICVIALSMAYPVREYIAQRQQIDQLLAQHQAMAAQVKALTRQDARLSQTQYVERQAEDQLHMCFPNEQCYEIISGQSAAASTPKRQAPADPWYDKLWKSVQHANNGPR